LTEIDQLNNNKSKCGETRRRRRRRRKRRSLEKRVRHTTKPTLRRYSSRTSQFDRSSIRV
jgi:hypothetical protein